MTLVLGIGDIYHDSCAALIDTEDGILFACSEERFSRIKKDRRYPYEVLKYIIEKYSPAEIEVALAGSGFFEFMKGQIKSQIRHLLDYELMKKIPRSGLNPAPYGPLYILASHHFLKSKAYFERETRRVIRSNKAKILRMVRYDHHTCHASSAWFTSGFSKGYVLTYDNYGDKSFGTLWYCNGDDMDLIAELDYPGVNYAMLYMAVTQALGLIPGKHEGKLMGLAAYGKVHNEVIDTIMKIANYANWKASYFYVTDAIERKLKYRYKVEDIAASMQYVCEVGIRNIIEEYIGNGVHGSNICLAGGIFANVKLNRMIKDMGFSNIFIHPAMGDDGLALGAALYYISQRYGLKPEKLKHVYLGPEFSETYMERVIKNEKLDYVKPENIEEKVAELLAQSKTIARYHGRCEYGPRALGNRSILYMGQDKSVNDWLNKNLKRSEFMPFAPTILREYADRAFYDLKGTLYTAKFMTITFRCKNEFIQNYSGVVHIDGTARPQIISKEDNPTYYNIIKKYREYTGYYAVLNTSFNMHEEPIVLGPKDAIRAFKASRLDYMAIGPFLAKKRPLTFQERIDLKV